MKQITLNEYMTDNAWFNRDGTMTIAPKWVRGDRCGNCDKWQILPIEEQPPDGWGVMGLCGSHMSKNKQKTSQSSFCQEFKNKYE
jgi:hypothetical protein